MPVRQRSRTKRFELRKKKVLERKRKIFFFFYSISMERDRFLIRNVELTSNFESSVRTAALRTSSERAVRVRTNAIRNLKRCTDGYRRPSKRGKIDSLQYLDEDGHTCRKLSILHHRTARGTCQHTRRSIQVALSGVPAQERSTCLLGDP